MDQPTIANPITPEAVVPPQQVQPNAMPQAPARGKTALIAVVVLLIALLAAGGFFFWKSVQTESPASSQDNAAMPTDTPITDEVSALEAELEAIDTGSDAELTGLESQL